MSRTVYVDVVGGSAGDMLLAALVDAGASLGRIRETVDRVLPGRFRIAVEEVRRGGLRALHLSISDARTGGAEDQAALPARPLATLVAAVERARLDPPVSKTARSILDRLGEAEARVHGVSVEAVKLFELGDDDTLLDVVGIAAALADLAVERVAVSPIPLGTGPAPPRRHAHGSLPLPAAATIELLRGFEVRAEGRGETVTPTAAAVFAALGEPTPGPPPMRLEAVGYGAGTDDPQDRANIVRVLVGSAVEAADHTPAGGEEGTTSERRLVVLEANVDDLTPELVADAVRALFAAGALDAWTAPIQMKKGRPGLLLTALADPEAEERLREAFFRETSTFGVRVHDVRRAELERRVVSVPVADGDVRVKVGLLAGRPVTATPEHDDVAAVASRAGRSVRDVYAEAAASARGLLRQETRA